jgi:hypothetical protein
MANLLSRRLLVSATLLTVSGLSAGCAVAHHIPSASVAPAAPPSARSFGSFASMTGSRAARPSAFVLARQKRALAVIDARLRGQNRRRVAGSTRALNAIAARRVGAVIAADVAKARSLRSRASLIEEAVMAANPAGCMARSGAFNRVSTPTRAALRAESIREHRIVEGCLAKARAGMRALAVGRAGGRS